MGISSKAPAKFNSFTVAEFSMPTSFYVLCPHLSKPTNHAFKLLLNLQTVSHLSRKAELVEIEDRLGCASLKKSLREMSDQMIPIRYDFYVF